MDNRLIILGLLLILIGCSKPTTDKTSKPLIVTTTGMIKDAVENIVADKAVVIALMGPGVDPHLYKATQGDLDKLTRADIIFYNGLHLEGKMGDVLDKLGRTKPVIPVASKIDTSLLHRVPQYNNSFDPHIWFDVALWQEAVGEIGRHIQEFDSENAIFYSKNLQDYNTQLDSLHQQVKTSLSQIPDSLRVLITAHDAFGYFGKAYDIEVRGLQGISTLSEYGLRDVADLVDFIVNRQIKAVFVETSVSRKAIEAVVEGCKQKGFDVKIGGKLYSDAMGEAGTPEGTYLGMVNANVKTIVEALK